MQVLCNRMIMSIVLEPRVLDIIMRKDKTLVCTFEDNFKQNGINSGQLLPAVCILTWPKYNKHHHDLKNQQCCLIDLYIRKIFWPTAPCQGCPEKEIINRLVTGLLCSVRFFVSILLKSFHSLLNENVTILTSSNNDWRRG